MADITDIPDNFGGEGIRKCLNTRWLGKENRLLFYRETDSTNEEVKRQAENGALEGLLVAADLQTAGKGRKGREWSNPAGVNIAMSFLLKPDFSPDTASMLTLLMALSCAKAIKNVAGLESGIKWPNDIVHRGKKLVGILTEMSIDEDEIGYVVVGTGINVNGTEFPGDIKDTATSLFIETGHPVSRSALTAECALQFEKYYGIFKKDLDLRSLKDEYNALCVNCGKRVKVLDPAGSYEGTARGINGNGKLIVNRDNGSVTEIGSGEVSVRGVYGYV